jgi:hypothetical protein
MLNFLLNDPSGFKSKLSSEIQAVQKKFAGKDVKIVIRWHDAGDFFSDAYLNLAYSVAKQFPEVDFYAYTKMAGVAQGDKPDNFIINFSMGAQPAQQKQIDFAKTKHSTVVPGELFKDLIQKDKEGKISRDEKGRYMFGGDGLNTLKQRMAKKFNISPDSIITYDQLMQTKPGTEPKYNVIVAPGDGDDSANRKDVLGTYLLIH